MRIKCKERGKCVHVICENQLCSSGLLMCHGWCLLVNFWLKMDFCFYIIWNIHRCLGIVFCVFFLIRVFKTLQGCTINIFPYTACIVKMSTFSSKSSAGCDSSGSVEHTKLGVKIKWSHFTFFLDWTELVLKTDYFHGVCK